MIKKFKEYLNENVYKKDFCGITQEELGDQFLRLEEILNCTVLFPHIDIADDILPVTVLPQTGHKKSKYLDRINIELIQIKDRLESMFDVTVAIKPRQVMNGSFKQVTNGSFIKITKRESIKESKEETKELQDIISYDEVEDQFLRIKEVLGNRIEIAIRRYDYDTNYYFIVIKDPSGGNINYCDETYEELRNIKLRMEDQYTLLSVLNKERDNVHCLCTFIYKKNNHETESLLKKSGKILL